MSNDRQKFDETLAIKWLVQKKKGFPRTLYVDSRRRACETLARIAGGTLEQAYAWVGYNHLLCSENEAEGNALTYFNLTAIEWLEPMLRGEDPPIYFNSGVPSKRCIDCGDVVGGGVGAHQETPICCPSCAAAEDRTVEAAELRELEQRTKFLESDAGAKVCMIDRFILGHLDNVAHSYGPSPCQLAVAKWRIEAARLRDNAEVVDFILDRVGELESIDADIPRFKNAVRTGIICGVLRDWVDDHDERSKVVSGDLMPRHNDERTLSVAVQEARRLGIELPLEVEGLDTPADNESTALDLIASWQRMRDPEKIVLG